MSKLNEFSLNIPALSTDVEPSFQTSTVVIPQAGETVDDSIVVGSPDAQHDSSRVTVYANNISPISYAGDAGGVAAFDIVFSVGITCEDGSCKTYQVVKRIGIDKCKIASEVQGSVPMSIVEGKKVQETKAPEGKVQLSEMKRLRVIAGLE